MKKKMLSSVLIFMLLFVVGCSDDPLETDKELIDFVSGLEKTDWGMPDYWITKNTAFGRVKVVLVFGYADNLSACLEMIQPENEKYTAANFRCEPAQ